MGRRVLLGMVVDLWDIIQGFSQATAWMEQYKATQKDIQKANGLIYSLCVLYYLTLVGILNIASVNEVYI